jgi:radical SAM superfamily enzyme YgiQ (UPF0313 family)
MKILLVCPPTNEGVIGVEKFLLFEPLALEYIGAAVKDAHQVKLLDLRIAGIEEYKKTVETFQPDIIGTGGFTVDVHNIKRIMKIAKQVSPGIVTVVGGHHATMVPRDFFEEEIDIIVSGEGTGPFRKICDQVSVSGGLENIENIYFRKNGQMVFTFPKEHPPLDSLPAPARELTAEFRHNYKFTLLSGVTAIALIRGSLGCWFSCKFCAVRRLTGQKLLNHSVQRVVEELASIREPYVFWVDDEIFLEHERALTLAKEIKQAGIRKQHLISCRADTVCKHPELLKAWADIGLHSVFIGFESHSDEGLKKMRKGSTIESNREAVRICHQYNIKVRGNFIVRPDFSKKDFKECVNFVKKMDVDVLGFSIMTPLPGTELYDECEDILTTHDYNLYDLAHAVTPTRLPLKEFHRQHGLLYDRTLTLRKKISLLRQMTPEVRKFIMASRKEVERTLRNAYLDY